MNQELDERTEGARIVVLNMLVSGYQPEEIVAYLRDSFGIADAESVVAAAAATAA